MKYVALNNAPNVSRSRVATSPSLKLDDRGFPHISYLDKKNGQNEVNYSYWDGKKWSYNNIPSVYISNIDIVYSPNSLALDDEFKPYIAFARKAGNGSKLSLVNYVNGWNFNELSVDYDVGWIGVVKVQVISGVSSSSSFSSSNSSRLSSSSSSYDDAIFFVVVYDITNGQFKIYGVTDGVWRLKGLMSAITGGYETTKINSCGDELKIGISFIDDSANIQYNFFDLQTEDWIFPLSFQLLQTPQIPVSYGSVTNMDVVGTNIGSNAVMIYTWLSRDDDYFYVGNVMLYESGSEIPCDGSNPVLEASLINIVTSTDYIVNGYRNVAICLDEYNLPVIVVNGIGTNVFTLNVSNNWTSQIASIDSISNGVVANSIRLEYYNTPNIALAANSGDIYYFEPEFISSVGLSSPDMAILTDKKVFRTTYRNGQLSGEYINDTNNNEIGSILIDSKKPLLITSDIGNTSDLIRSVDLVKNLVLSSRSIALSAKSDSIDVDQITGKTLVTESSLNRVVIYSQDESPIYITTVNGTLKNPLDAKFDYIRRRIWIADTGNNRVLGYDIDIGDARLVISDIIYPHALSADIVNGGVFVKAYVDDSINNQIVYHYKIDGTMISSFASLTNDFSSSSETSLSIFGSNTMVYDSVRNKIWWLDNKMVCVADETGYQVTTYDLSNLGYYEIKSIDVEYSTGNVFVAAKDIHEWYLIEISRDNKEILGTSYIRY